MPLGRWAEKSGIRCAHTGGPGYPRPPLVRGRGSAPARRRSASGALFAPHAGNEQRRRKPRDVTARTAEPPRVARASHP